MDPGRQLELRKGKAAQIALTPYTVSASDSLFQWLVIMRLYLQRGPQRFVMVGLWSGFARKYGCTSVPTLEAEPAEEPPLEPAAARAEQATWVEIEIVDMEDQPVNGEKYRIITPDGKAFEGRTDANGRARILAIPHAGSCDVFFPDLDKDAWEAA